MASIKNNNENGRYAAKIDVTKNVQITEPAKGATPTILEQLKSDDPVFEPVRQVPGEGRKLSPIQNGPIDLNGMKPVTDVSDILPKRKPEMSALDNMLIKNLDAAVERTKKQISADQEAIMDQIYKEQQEMAMEAYQREYNNNNSTSNTNLSITEEPEIEKDDDEDDDFDYSDYTTPRDNIPQASLFIEEDEPEEDRIYNPFSEEEEDLEQHEEDDDMSEERDNNQLDEEDIGKSVEDVYDAIDEPEEEDELKDEDYGEAMSSDEIKALVNKEPAPDTPEEIEEDEKTKTAHLVEELTRQTKERVGNTMKRIDITKFKVSKKPVSASKAMKISNISRANTADWVLLAAERPVTVTGLSGPQIITLNSNNSSKNRLNTFRDMFKILYDGIVDNNKPDFESWLKITKFSDVSHLYFAYYKATFGGSNFVHYTCTNKKCDKGVFIKDIDFKDMVRFKSDKFKKKFNAILNRDTTSPSKEYTSERMQISDNYVVDITSPSIWSVIIETASLSDDFLEKYGDLIDTVSYIDTIYLINHSTMELEPVEIKYDKNNQTSNAARKIRTFNDILKTLTSDQFFALRAAINELDKESDQITYLIPGATCPYCGTTVDEEEMAPDTMLFTRHRLAAFASLPSSSIQ